MGSEVRGLPEAAPLKGDGEVAKEASIGRYLAQQRSLRGISVDELAAATAAKAAAASTVKAKSGWW